MITNYGEAQGNVPNYEALNSNEGRLDNSDNPEAIEKLIGALLGNPDTDEYKRAYTRLYLTAGYIVRRTKVPAELKDDLLHNVMIGLIKSIPRQKEKNVRAIYKLIQTIVKRIAYATIFNLNHKHAELPEGYDLPSEENALSTLLETERLHILTQAINEYIAHLNPEEQNIKRKLIQDLFFSDKPKEQILAENKIDEDQWKNYRHRILEKLIEIAKKIQKRKIRKNNS